MASEMGKPVRDGRVKIEKCAWVCDYYADNALTALQSEVVETDAFRSYVSFQPLGVIMAVMPWNYPFWQVFRFAAPALMAGNAGILKHASNAPGCSFRKWFEELLVEHMKAKKMGDPLKEDTEIGPQARSDLRNDLHR